MDALESGVRAVRSGPARELVLRYAREVALLLRLGFRDPIQRTLMAARTASLVLAGMRLEDRGRCLEGAPRELVDATELANQLPEPDRMAEIARGLLWLEGVPLPSYSTDQMAARLRKCWHFCAPVEYLLLQGGDSRLQCDPTTGRNMYGCQPVPENADYVTFASSTATSISEDAYAAAESCRQRLLSSVANDDDIGHALDEEFDSVRQKLVALLGLDASRVDVALSPSGTDAHLQALAIARFKAGGRPILTIVMAPNETGSGVAYAASGRHFADSTALGFAVARGEPIEGLGGNVTLATVPIRDSSGAPRSPDAVVDDIANLVEQARKCGRFVLLQVIDVSKTGLVTPGVSRLRRLVGRFPDGLLLTVDACQLRVGNEALADYLDTGALVCITASKFFTAPPFAGALLIPRSVALRQLENATFAAGCDAYFSRADWPSNYGVAGGVRTRANLGVLLRWHAGLREMSEFASIPAAARSHILASLGGAIATLIACTAILEPVLSPGRAARGFPAQGAWDEVQSIFPFRVRRSISAFLTIAELRELQRKMHEDVTAMLPPDASFEERRLARLRCHIGQPVALEAAMRDDVAAAVRISTSARLVRGIWAGGNPSACHERLTKAIDDARDVLAKLVLVHRCLFNDTEDRPAAGR